MMMPANFSAISENEMTYVNGGASLSDILAPSLTLANWKKFNTNMVTIVGNTFVGKLVEVTLGTMFGGAWGADGTVSISDAMSNAFYKNGANDKSTLNKVLATVGIGAAVYQLGMVGTKSNVSDPAKTWDGVSTNDDGTAKLSKTMWFTDGLLNQTKWLKNH